MKLLFVLLGICLVGLSQALPSSENKTLSNASSEARKARYDERKFSKYDSAEGVKKDSMVSSKNLIRTLVKLFFGNDEESAATSRQILNVLVSLLDMLKNTFGQRARSAQARGLRDTLDDAATAGASMLKGYVKSILAKDKECAQRHLCEASKEAVKDGREIGYLIAQFGGYASSYALENQKASPFQSNYDAARKGRSGEDCVKLYQSCNEA